MKQGNDEAFKGSIPEFYDRYLTPLIFESYAHDLAERVVSLDSSGDSSGGPQDVLELACGTGVVTRALAPRLTRNASYTVSYLSQGMLDHAASRQPEDDRISWRQADALALPFPDDSFDIVVCQFSVMFFPDKIAGYSEAARVLKPGGRFNFNVWDDIKSNEFADVVTDAASAVYPDDPPLFLARTPHGYHDPEVIQDELRSSGFTEIRIDQVEKVSSAPSARGVALAYCHGTPLRNEIKAHDAGLLDRITDKATDMLEKRFGRGPISGKISGLVVTASA